MNTANTKIGTGIDVNSVSQEIYQLISDLYPICRSITGDGVRKTLDFVHQHISLELHNALGIRVVSIYPGRTASPMQAKIYETEGREYKPELLLQAEDVADAVVSALSLPRTAEVTDINIRPFLKS